MSIHRRVVKLIEPMVLEAKEPEINIYHSSSGSAILGCGENAQEVCLQ